MTQRSFQQLDLNLLKVFVVLFEELNTRKAAERLYTTQPSISRALAKLRDHFDDPLFIRTQYGLSATDRSIELNQTLPALMQSLEQSLSYSEIDPSQLSGTLRIATNQLLGERYNAQLYLAFSALAPNLSIEIESWSNDSALKLAQGNLQVGINYFPLTLSKEIVNRKIAVEHFCLYMRKDHAYLNQPSIQGLADYPLATILVSDWNLRQTLTEKILLEHDVKVQVAYRSENINSIFQVISNSDVIFPAAQGLLQPTLHSNLVAVPIPDGLSDISFDVSLYYHMKHRQSPYYLWLEKVIRSIIV